MIKPNFTKDLENVKSIFTKAYNKAVQLNEIMNSYILEKKEEIKKLNEIMNSYILKKEEEIKKIESDISDTKKSQEETKKFIEKLENFIE